MNYFDNHFLFSETYIKEFIIEQKKKKSILNEDVENAFKQIKDWNAEYSVGGYSNDPWIDYIHAVLDVLKFEKKQSNTCVELYAGAINNGAKPVAICYMIDKAEELSATKKGSYYACEAVQAARLNGVEWAMLTNGYQWRIYYTKNVSPYENYFEVDIEESIKNNTTADESFKLFYLFFNVKTYCSEDNTMKIEKIKELSDKKAETIEDSLRGKAEEILKELCYGLKENMNKESYSEEEKKEIYNDAIILLYRLLFFGYAESRKLLPVIIDDPEYAFSFKQLCEEAKNEINSGNSYKTKDEFGFWSRLDDLRMYVNSSYNGGLFHNEDKYVLREHRISNGRLTKCLAELSYNQDKSGSYAIPIEYKDLSVRNLGSIYEGLLEYRLFIADEQMVQRKSKGQVKYLRAADVKLQNSDVKNLIEKGGIYLSQDALERKETGAYYTPEDVVEYIVENTVGKKLDDLKEELNASKKDLSEQLKFEEEGSSRRRGLQNQIDEITFNFINDRLLTLSIIDSAMGSGHFLVNAAYRVANEIVGILSENNWDSNNDEIVVEIKYWKRKVVENCIYGIDINGLSVALARLSLWLISAANDKALSFLDHHLKEGNSIIGTDRTQVSVKDSRSSLFEVSYEDYMKHILIKYDELKTIGSNTKADVARQKEIYDEINNELELVKLKYNYYLSNQFSAVVEKDISYLNLMRSNDVGDFLKFKNSKAYEFANDMKFFHWELEFPDVFQKEGFDILIGNPPYVDVAERDYKHSVFNSITSKNLYAYMMEIGLKNLKNCGKYGYIVPLSLITAQNMISIRKTTLVSSSDIWLSSYGIRPSKIFKNVDQRVCIAIGIKNDESTKVNVNTSSYLLWNSSQRNQLFDNILYIKREMLKKEISQLYKISTEIEVNIIEKLLNKKKVIKDYLVDSKMKHADEKNENHIYYHSAVRYWIKALESPPEFINEGVEKKSSKYKKIVFKNTVSKSIPIAVINSSLFFWYWVITSDCRDLTLDTIVNFRGEFDDISESVKSNLEASVQRLLDSYVDNSHLKTCKMASIGEVSYREYHPKYSKAIIDEIDVLLGTHYGFTQEEVDFIINYQLRYRMGEDSIDEEVE